MARCTCTHFAGSHAHNGEGTACSVMLVSGPPVEDDNLFRLDLHGGRTVSRCSCERFTPETLQETRK